LTALDPTSELTVGFNRVAGEGNHLRRKVL